MIVDYSYGQAIFEGEAVRETNIQKFEKVGKGNTSKYIDSFPLYKKRLAISIRF